MSFWGLVYAAVNERMRLQLGQGWGYKAGRFAGGVCSGCGFSACLLLPFFKVVKGLASLLGAASCQGLIPPRGVHHTAV